MLFLDSIGADHRMWDGVRAALACPSVAYDARGHGRSPAIPGEADIEAPAEFAAHLERFAALLEDRGPIRNRPDPGTARGGARDDQHRRPPVSSLHDHIAALEAAGLLVRVDRPIGKDSVMHPLVRWQFVGGMK